MKAIVPGHSNFLPLSYGMKTANYIPLYHEDKFRNERKRNLENYNTTQPMGGVSQ
jgi:hypothetical protein